MPESFGTSYMLAQGGGENYQPMMKHNWELQIGTMPTVLTAKSVIIPRTALEKGEIFHANERVKYAKMPNPSDMTAEIFDTVTPSIHDLLYNWFTQVYNPATGQMGIPSVYKQQAQIFLYDPLYNLIRSYTAIGMFPQHEPTPADAYVYDDQSPVVLPMVFSVDRVLLNSSVANTTGAGAGSSGPSA